MSEEEILDLPIEPSDNESDIRDDGEKAGRALTYVESGKNEMETERCRACEEAYGSVDSASDELYDLEGSLESYADNLVDWQNWGQSWKDTALDLIRRYEPETLSEEENFPSETTSSPSKDLARLNKESNRNTCAACGNQLKEPWPGLKHCPVCEP